MCSEVYPEYRREDEANNPGIKGILKAGNSCSTPFNKRKSMSIEQGSHGLNHSTLKRGSLLLPPEPLIDSPRFDRKSLKLPSRTEETNFPHDFSVKSALKQVAARTPQFIRRSFQAGLGSYSPRGSEESIDSRLQNQDSDTSNPPSPRFRRYLRKIYFINNLIYSYFLKKMKRYFYSILGRHSHKVLQCLFISVLQRSWVLPQKLNYSNTYTFATLWCNPVIFKMGSKRIDRLKYLRSTMLDCKDTEFWKSELGAKAEFLCVSLINFLEVNYKI